MRRLTKVFFGVFFLVTCFALPVGAAGPEPRPSRELTGLFTPDPPGTIRRITRTGGSDCIGETVTPVCAIDTDLACGVQRDPKLCAIAYQKSLDDPTLFQPSTSYKDPNYYQTYRIVSVHRADRAAEQPPPDPARPPRALLIGIRWSSCYTSMIERGLREEDSCIPKGPNILYTLEHNRLGWRIVRVYAIRWGS